MSRCRSCRRGIRWAFTANGKRMPLDADPHPDGNVVLEDGDSGQPIAVVCAPGDPWLAAGPTYMPHWASCPQAKSWKR